MNVFYHTGCIGDIIAALPIIRQLGGGALKIGDYKNPDWASKRMGGARYEAIRPLLEAQPYITSISFEDGAPHTHDLANWRSHHRKDRTLTESQASWLGITQPIDMNPWIGYVRPDPAMAGKIVITRTARYQNPTFPWHHLVSENWRRMVFIGLPDEHKAFVKTFGLPVAYRPTSDMMEVAEVIAGSELLICNQTAACWIGLGLGHPLIQETSPVTQDSIIRRPNAQYCLDGNLQEPDGLRFTLFRDPTTEVESFENALPNHSSERMNQSSMLCVLGFCQHDRYKAITLAERIRSLGGVANHDCLLVYPNGVNADAVIEPLRRAFRRVDIAPYNATLAGWPYGPNEMAAFAMQHVASNPTFNTHYLWLEPDCDITGPTWLDAIDFEYQRCGKLILGVLNDTMAKGSSIPIGKHVVGVAVYPKLFPKLCPIVRSTTATAIEHFRMKREPKAFDVYFAPYTVPNTSPTRLIQHLWKSRNYRRGQDGTIICDSESSESRVDPVALIIHGCKDTSLFEILTNKGGEPKNAQAIHSNRKDESPGPLRESEQASRPGGSQNKAKGRPPKVSVSASFSTPTPAEAPPPPEGIDTSSPEWKRAVELDQMPYRKLLKYASGMGIKTFGVRAPQIILAVIAKEQLRDEPTKSDILEEPEPPAPAALIPSDPLPPWTENPPSGEIISESMKAKMLALRQERALRKQA